MKLRDFIATLSVAGVSLLGAGAVACNAPGSQWHNDASTPPDGGLADGGLATALRLSELMADNEGAWIDEWGEAEDWIELTNYGEASIALAGYALGDGLGARRSLPDRTLAPGGAIVLFADSQPEQGPRHLPFKLSSKGDRVLLYHGSTRVDETSFGALLPNASWARFESDGGWLRCRYASPGRKNGPACLPPEPLDSPPDAVFEPFDWPAQYPPRPRHLVLNELALRSAPARIELYNAGKKAVDLSEYALTLRSLAPDQAWPLLSEGGQLTLPEGELQPGERALVTVPEASLQSLDKSPAFEGVATLFESDGASVDRVDFMRWPKGTFLARPTDGEPQWVYCTNETLQKKNRCEPLRSRDVGDRVRYLRTPSDFSALSAGESDVGIDAVKFVLDQAAPGAVHLLSSAAWPLHYTFIREQIYREPPLDRCDPQQNAEFTRGWYAFSEQEYFETEDARRFLLGTLSLHGGADISAVEYAFGDKINGDQMVRAYWSVLPHTLDPTRWVLRPQDDAQVAQLQGQGAQAPIVAPNAPFVGVTYQPLTEGVAYGTLRFVPASELSAASLGPDIILLTDDVPNDIPFVGGLVTEAFQTPLAHVNVLSMNRGTPNAALRDAREMLQEHIGELVRLEVASAELRVERTTPEAATAYWQQVRPTQASFVPPLDTTVRGVVELSEHDLTSLPAVGAKAAQMAELLRVNKVPAECVHFGLPDLPASPLAVPVVHYLEHFRTSGAEALLRELESDAAFGSDPLARAEQLLLLQERILKHPVDAELLSSLEQAVAEHFGEARVRFRSSSNTEDLPTFNGAGLYTSTSAQVGDNGRRVDDALRTVWASLWNPRAFDERVYGGVDNTSVAMGVLIHGAFLSEAANGVGVSRNVLDPIRGDIYYVNVQAGEASVTNPAPGVTTEQLLYQWRRTPRILYESSSSLLPALLQHGEHVLSFDEVEALACALQTFHNWFRPKLDPERRDPWFAIESEFKLVDEPRRRLVFKQARPHPFRSESAYGDCREF